MQISTYNRILELLNNPMTLSYNDVITITSIKEAVESGVKMEDIVVNDYDKDGEMHAFMKNEKGEYTNIQQGVKKVERNHVYESIKKKYGSRAILTAIRKSDISVSEKKSVSSSIISNSTLTEDESKLLSKLDVNRYTQLDKESMIDQINLHAKIGAGKIPIIIDENVVKRFNIKRDEFDYPIDTDSISYMVNEFINEELSRKDIVLGLPNPEFLEAIFKNETLDGLVLEAILKKCNNLSGYDFCISVDDVNSINRLIESNRKIHGINNHRLCESILEQWIGDNTHILVPHGTNRTKSVVDKMTDYEVEIKNAEITGEYKPYSMELRENLKKQENGI